MKDNFHFQACIPAQYRSHCKIGLHQEIFFLWRPFLPDPTDDHVLEVAVAAGCDAIVTYNKRDFKGIEKFGLRILDPRELLSEIGVLK